MRLDDVSRQDDTLYLRRIVFEKSKVGAFAHAHPQIMHDARLTVDDDPITRTLLFNLKSYIWRHKVGEKEFVKPVTETVRIDHHLSLLTAIASAIMATAALFYNYNSQIAFLISLAGFIILFVGFLVYPRTRTITKNFTVHNDYYNTFPENTVIYPEHVGKAVVQVHSFAKEDE